MNKEMRILGLWSKIINYIKRSLITNNFSFQKKQVYVNEWQRYKKSQGKWTATFI